MRVAGNVESYSERLQGWKCEMLDDCTFASRKSEQNSQHTFASILRTTFQNVDEGPKFMESFDTLNNDMGIFRKSSADQRFLTSSPAVVNCSEPSSIDDFLSNEEWRRTSLRDFFLQDCSAKSDFAFHGASQKEAESPSTTKLFSPNFPFVEHKVDSESDNSETDLTAVACPMEMRDSGSTHEEPRRYRRLLGALDDEERRRHRREQVRQARRCFPRLSMLVTYPATKERP